MKGDLPWDQALPAGQPGWLHHNPAAFGSGVPCGAGFQPAAGEGEGGVRVPESVLSDQIKAEAEEAEQESGEATRNFRFTP